ncbi:MAG TPA: Gmad2 immunoglobulin-like domain-containing protein [Actinomycetota bacterium]
MRDAKERLRALDRIDPPDVWHRATTTEPRPDLDPDPAGAPWQRRVAAAAVGFAVFAGVVALALGAFDRDGGHVGVGGPSDPAPVVAATIEVRADDGQPSAVMTVADDPSPVDGYGLSYCWTGDGVGQCVDVVQPEFRLDDHVRLPSGGIVRVVGDADRVRLAIWIASDPTDRLRMEGDGAGGLRLPDVAGRYVLSIDARWEGGDREFLFPIEIVGASPSSDAPELAPIEVARPARDAEIASPVTVAGTADVFEGTVQVWILDATRNLIADTFTTATCGNGCRGDFTVDVAFSVDAAQPGTIVVFSESPEDGSRMHAVEIPVTLLPTPDPVADGLEGAWTDASGAEVPDGDPGEGLVLHTLEGADHCGWTSVTFMHMGWPVGSVVEKAGEARQYVRDPQGLLGAFTSSPFDPDATLPDGAAATGFRHGAWELWKAPSDEDEAVYVVNGDPSAGGAVERWVRTSEFVACA